ncbi:MAG: MATE family efflux transporter [Lachnospiraceae bacterium]|nr:MATE family efflux transporter [Lachnospiraceae bacterium]
MFAKGNKKEVNLTEGSIIRGLIAFAIPLFLGQLLQQFYNMADAWVVGNFASNDAFAAVSLASNLSFVVIGLFNGIAIGGGVVISRYFGAKDEEQTNLAIHTNLLFGILAGILSTVVGLLLVPTLLTWMNTPDSVMPHALDYFNMYFAGVSTVILYNTCMSIMRAVGDSVRPLYYLLISSVVNVILDLVFVAGFGWGAGGAAFATVLAQGLSVLLCLIRMCSGKDSIKIQMSYFRFDKAAMAKIIRQGLPGGIQNTVNSIGNMVVQSCINTFGAFAISGYGAFHKVEGIAFLPIMSMCMALPTFVSQNLGAGEVERAKKGTFIGIFMGCAFAEVMGLFIYYLSPYLIGAFVSAPEAIAYGVGHGKTVAFFLFLLGFTHCAAGALRGCGKAMIPMVTLLLCWCGIRILYVTTALKYFPVFQTISWAYPLTWGLSALILFVCLLRLDWSKSRV